MKGQVQKAFGAGMRCSMGRKGATDQTEITNGLVK